MPVSDKSKKNLIPRETVYGEPKKKHTIWLTAVAWEGLEELAKEHKLSVSELVERIGRKTLPHKDYKDFVNRD